MKMSTQAKTVALTFLINDRYGVSSQLLVQNISVCNLDLAIRINFRDYLLQNISEVVIVLVLVSL
jgi:ABC-type uncharacterized transport system YnjBCD ATPase subunit